MRDDPIYRDTIRGIICALANATKVKATAEEQASELLVTNEVNTPGCRRTPWVSTIAAVFLCQFAMITLCWVRSSSQKEKKQVRMFRVQPGILEVRRQLMAVLLS
jgi:hypothetical protein